MNLEKKINLRINLYIYFIIFYSIFYLYTKHNVGNDSSISEWLINYQGGFTRRGLGGEINFFLQKIFDLPLRKIIFFTQSFFHFIYLILLLNYLKNYQFNIIQLFALFTPIFLIYPIAEIEVLGRKEMLLYVFFISTVYLCSKKFSNNLLNTFICITFPVIVLIWEQVVLYAPYFVILIIIKNDLQTFSNVFKKTLLIFTPSLIVFFLIFIYPLSNHGHQQMCEYLNITYGEQCYMSASLLVTNTIYFDTFQTVHENASIENYLRYLLIFLIGFGPLNYLVFTNSFKQKNNYLTKNFKLYQIHIILLVPVILLFLFGYDWGRWINISYTFSVILYLFFLKSDLITNFLIINNFLLRKIFNKQKILFLVFFFFSFFWNPKTVITGDIATNSLYKIIYNSTKLIFNHDGIRLFQENPIIKFHKKYIE